MVPEAATHRIPGRTGGRCFCAVRAAGLLLALNPTAIYFDCLVQKAVLDLFFFSLVLMLAGGAADVTISNLGDPPPKQLLPVVPSST